MSPGQTAERGDDLGFPRVSGDEPPAIDCRALRRVFSPRERG